jgi:hypothetical protein
MPVESDLAATDSGDFDNWGCRRRTFCLHFDILREEAIALAIPSTDSELILGAALQFMHGILLIQECVCALMTNNISPWRTNLEQLNFIR